MSNDCEYRVYSFKILSLSIFRLSRSKYCEARSRSGSENITSAVSEGDGRAAVPSDKARRLRVASNKPDGDVRRVCVRA